MPFICSSPVIGMLVDGEKKQFQSVLTFLILAKALIFRTDIPNGQHKIVR
jgi:hypothetical protein